MLVLIINTTVRYNQFQWLCANIKRRFWKLWCQKQHYKLSEVNTLSNGFIGALLREKMHLRATWRRSVPTLSTYR